MSTSAHPRPSLPARRSTASTASLTPSEGGMPAKNHDHGCKFNQFYRQYQRRVERYAAQTARSFHLPAWAVDDLAQAAWIAVMKVLPYWRHDGGKGVFNYCAPAISVAMYRTVRSIKGYRPCQVGSMDHQFASFEDTDNFDHHRAIEPELEDLIDLHRTLERDPKPQDVMRYIMLALSPASGADVGRQFGVTKQAICLQKKRTQLRLRNALRQTG